MAGAEVGDARGFGVAAGAGPGVRPEPPAQAAPPAMRVRSLGFATDLMERRLAGAEVADRGDHVLVHSPRNPEFYWGNFILVPGPLGPGDAARWRREFASEFPAARHLAIGIDGCDGAAGEVGDLVTAGANIDTSIVLTARSLIEPIPVAAELRPLASDEDWRQLLALRRVIETEEWPVTDASERFTRNRVAEQRMLVEAGHATWFGAFADSVLRASLGVVFASGHPARYQSVETDLGWRRRGLAAALVHLAGRTILSGSVANRLVIVADPAGPAIKLYRRLGFADRERQVQVQREPSPSPS